ncbi:LysR substrate-binding domain-containing protein [Notoacmeibacter ruber]|nr:LysR substrate-binding domain-containing protein [Notoacmeibacter ruber]
MSLNFRDLEVFYQAVRSGTLTAAAAALHTSQPTVSRTLSKLERQLGFPLFERRKGHVSPTPEALALFKEIEQSYIGIERISSRVQEIKARRNRGLNLACYPALSQVFLPEVIAHFASEHPDFSASILVSGPVEARRMMENGEIDLLVCNDIQTAGDLMKIPMVSARFQCVLPKDHPLCRKEVVTLEDLREQRLIALDAEPELDWRGHQELFSSLEPPPRIDFHVKRSAIAYSLVAQGLGISILEPFSAAHWRSSGVVTRPFLPELKYDYSIYLPRLRAPSRYVDGFVEALKSHCKRLGFADG